MWGQRFSRPLRNQRSSARVRSANGILSRPVCDGQTGFIQHAAGFPLHYRRLWLDTGFRPPRRDPSPAAGEIGLMFDTVEYIRPGSVLEVTIPMPGEEARFRGRVVLVRNHGDYYQIGLWLKHAADASRMRIVEQICHIESYLKQRKFFDGPYNINRERLAAEWIAENAGSVPTL